MKRFKLIQKCEVFEHCYVDAETREEAKNIYDNEGGLDWKHDEYGDSNLIAVDECTEDGENITNDVENGEFV